MVYRDRDVAAGLVIVDHAVIVVPEDELRRRQALWGGRDDHRDALKAGLLERGAWVRNGQGRYRYSQIGR